MECLEKDKKQMILEQQRIVKRQDGEEKEREK